MFAEMIYYIFKHHESMERWLTSCATEEEYLQRKRYYPTHIRKEFKECLSHDINLIKIGESVYDKAFFNELGLGPTPTV
jgi:hypothetical protein